MSVNRTPLSPEALRERLARHRLYMESEGRDGQSLELLAVQVADLHFKRQTLDEFDARPSHLQRCNFARADLYR
ncbi:MAG: hypothetical protein ACFCBW_14320, partial [Candidatus Competibacterales bacterium]